MSLLSVLTAHLDLAARGVSEDDLRSRALEAQLSAQGIRAHLVASGEPLSRGTCAAATPPRAASAEHFES